MLKAVPTTRPAHTATLALTEDQRHAYNAAFEELSLPWHWDASTFTRVMAHGEGGLRHYLETEQPHLLRAYEASFLVNAIETARARSYAGMASFRRHGPMLPAAAMRPRLAA